MTEQTQTVPKMTGRQQFFWWCVVIIAIAVIASFFEPKTKPYTPQMSNDELYMRSLKHDGRAVNGATMTPAERQRKEEELLRKEREETDRVKQELARQMSK